MHYDEWTPPPAAFPPADPAGAPAPKRRRGLLAGAALVGAGAVAGAILGTTVLSGAATTTPTPSSGSGAGSSSSSCPRGGGPGHALALSGTVTAVGSSSVTIRTSSGTTTYQVGANSDIDKNGEAKLSDLKVGDAVRFSVTSGNVIDKLHAGNEALDRPRGGPGGMNGNGYGG